MDNGISPYKQYLLKIDPVILHNKITTFKNLNFRDMPYQYLQKKIGDVLSVPSGIGPMILMLPLTGSYSNGTKFYRVREINENNIFPDAFLEEDKVWSAPINRATVQRLNKDAESLLYTSPGIPEIAIEEKRIKDNEYFILIVYKALSNITVTQIGCHDSITELTDEENYKHSLINDFLRDIFTRDVGIGTEYLYKLSEIIAKDYFDLPPQIQHAWCYPSVIDKTKFNVCFRPESAKDRLKLNGILLCTKTGKLNNMHIKCQNVGEYVNGKLVLHHIGSKFQKEVFPEIS